MMIWQQQKKIRTPRWNVHISISNLLESSLNKRYWKCNFSKVRTAYCFLVGRTLSGGSNSGKACSPLANLSLFGSIPAKLSVCLRWQGFPQYVGVSIGRNLGRPLACRSGCRRSDDVILPLWGAIFSEISLYICWLRVAMHFSATIDTKVFYLKVWPCSYQFPTRAYQRISSAANQITWVQNQRRSGLYEASGGSKIETGRNCSGSENAKQISPWLIEEEAALAQFKILLVAKWRSFTVWGKLDPLHKPNWKYMRSLTPFYCYLWKTSLWASCCFLQSM